MSRVISVSRPRRCAGICGASRRRGLRPDLPTSAERGEIKALRKEVSELRRANEILKAASVFSRPSSTQTDRGEPLHR
jgi:transposase-like protein